MASVVIRKDGRVEIRESLTTPRGPRSRTLAVFRELSERDLDKAAKRASRPFDRRRVLERLRQLGVPCYGECASRAGRALLAELSRDKPLEPVLVRALRDATASLEEADVPPAIDPLLAWLGADDEERGDTLRDYLHQPSMIGPDIVRRASADKAMPLDESVVAASRALREADIPHAFGGRIAASYYSVPRASAEIEIWVLLPPAEAGTALACLARLAPGLDAAALSRHLAKNEDPEPFAFDWERARFSVAFASGDLERETRRRVRDVPFGEDRITIPSAEDLLIRLVLASHAGGRLVETQGWSVEDEIERILFSRIGEIDLGYVERWLDRLLACGDPRRGWFEGVARRIIDA